MRGGLIKGLVPNDRLLTRGPQDVSDTSMDISMLGGSEANGTVPRPPPDTGRGPDLARAKGGMPYSSLVHAMNRGVAEGGARFVVLTQARPDAGFSKERYRAYERKVGCVAAGGLPGWLLLQHPRDWFLLIRGGLCAMDDGLLLPAADRPPDRPCARSLPPRGQPPRGYSN
jgi:hypothetical protein